MQLSRQQIETLSFFDRVPLEWRMRAEGKLPRVNVIAQRNACVHRVHAMLPEVESMLDIGCGTGELVLDMAASGVRATGIDFAPEMIRACEQRRRETGRAGARFHCGSIFEYQAPAASEDLIAALGLIEYISPSELTQLLALCHRLLRPAGVLVLSSRNRLFNLVSLNDYTRLEISLGTVDALLREALAYPAATTARDALLAVAPPHLPHPKSQPKSWIDVSLRYQYTPAGLAGLAAEAGYEPMALFPVHYHPMPPDAATDGLGKLHIDFSTLVHDCAPDDHRLIPFSSSFVLAARKVG